MTDKERLEEIKQIRNDMEEYMNPDGSVEDYPRYDELALFIIDDYLDYLIEQAERVQELEGANTRLLEAFDTKTRVHESLLKDYATLKERVQELEQKLKYAETDLALAERLLKNEKRHKLTYRKVAQRYQSEKNRYREALEFYADKDNYKLEHFAPNINDYMSTVDYDEGMKARKALDVEFK